MKNKPYRELPRSFSMKRHLLALSLTYFGGMGIGWSIGQDAPFQWIYFISLVAGIIGMVLLGRYRDINRRLKWDLEDERERKDFKLRAAEKMLEAEREMHDITMEALMRKSRFIERSERRDAELREAKRRHPAGKAVRTFKARTPIPIRKLDTPTDED